jgi:hypothetical protein
MKTQRTTRYLAMAMIVSAFAVATWSCNKDDDPSLADLREDKLQYLEDSLRISDSLKRINAAGIVNYTITVINGSTSSLNNNGSGVGRSQATKTSVEGAIVTISQYGKVLTDTTDASGLVVFNGFFRSAVNVNIKATDFTEVNYIAAVSIGDSTRNSSISFVGNIIPIFETAGPNTATISGRATLQSDMTNKALETVPDGTAVSANIDAKNSLFESRFLTYSVDNVYNPACGCDILFVGELLQTSYSTGVIGTVTGGNYSLTVPAAVDGLPLSLQYSELAADATMFENTAGTGQHTIVRRTVYNDNSAISPPAPLATLPTGSSVVVTFESFDVQAVATAIISANTGAIERINVTNGGSGYLTGAGNEPLVQITGGGGTGATATATVGANGRVTAITLTSPGTGYTSAPTVNLLSGGTTATANSTLDANNQSVFSISVTAQGTGYTSAPTVVFTGGGGTGAAATAQVANGRVVAVIVTATGTAYTAAPTVTFTGGGGAGATATASMGLPVAQVNITGAGSNHVYAPTVTFSAPDFVNGVRAQGQAVIDPATRTVLGVLVTNPGSGYVVAPTVTLNGGGGAAAQAFLQGGTVIGFNITNVGDNYAYAPTIILGELNGTGSNGNGSGAAGTAVMSGGRLVGINITNAGSGYTSAPDVNIISGAGAVAYATVTNGGVTGFTVTDGGHSFAGAPRVRITGDGGGATATATVAGGALTGITATNPGSGYLDGNTPAAPERFSATKGTAIQAKPGISYINDVYYGTGAVRSSL